LKTSETVLHLAARSMPKYKERVNVLKLMELTRLKGKYDDERNKRKDREQEELKREDYCIDSSEENEVDEETKFREFEEKLNNHKVEFLLKESSFWMICLILNQYERHQLEDDMLDDRGRRGLIACDEDFDTLFHKAAMLNNELVLELLFVWTKFSDKIQAQDIALVDRFGHTSLHKAVLASKTRLYTCDRNHQLSVTEINKISQDRCNVCTKTVNKKGGIVWKCTDDDCNMDGSYGREFRVCNGCYMMSKNAIIEDQKTQGLKDTAALGLFSLETMKLIAEKMTLPQLLIPTNERKTVLDLAVEKGKTKAALMLRSILEDKIKKYRAKLRESYSREDRANYYQDEVLELTSFFKEGLITFKHLTEAKSEDIRKNLKKALRKYWGDAGRQSTAGDKTYHGHLYHYAKYFCEGILATKHVLEVNHGERELLDVHDRIKIREIKRSKIDRDEDRVVFTSNPNMASHASMMFNEI